MDLSNEEKNNPSNKHEVIADLIERSKLGEDRAFEELLEIFRRMILRISKMYYFPDGDFDDVSQECLIAFWSAIESYDKNKSGKNPESYIYTCISRRMISALRKSTNKNSTFTTKALWTGDTVDYTSGTDSYSYSLSTSSPEILFMAAELEESYMQAMKEMSNKNFKAIAKLRYLGYSYKEISETLQLSSKDVDNILYRGRKSLKKLDLMGLN